MKLPTLDRMAIEDGSDSPERIATEIHRQLGDIPSPVPVREIARALDICEIREISVASFEGMLLTEPARDFGSIAVNARSSFHRRRFSIGHELGHFLCAWHRPTDEAGFRCSMRDMKNPLGDAQHIHQEKEANAFAIELLAPPRFFAPFARRFPDLQHVLELSSDLEISKIAAARRYVELHKQTLAVIVAKDGKYEYACRNDEFPFLNFRPGDLLPLGHRSNANQRLSDFDEADPRDWNIRTSGELAVQILKQDEDRALILLQVEHFE